MQSKWFVVFCLWSEFLTHTLIGSVWMLSGILLGIVFYVGGIVVTFSEIVELIRNWQTVWQLLAVALLAYVVLLTTITSMIFAFFGIIVSCVLFLVLLRERQYVVPYSRFEIAKQRKGDSKFVYRRELADHSQVSIATLGTSIILLVSGVVKILQFAILSGSSLVIFGAVLASVVALSTCLGLAIAARFYPAALVGR